MENTNLETVVEKLFSTKPVSQKMNEEIKNQVNRNKEALFRRIKPAQFEGQDKPLSEEDYQKVAQLADFIAQYVRDVGKEQAVLDLQVGLNLLNGYQKESLVKEKIKLEEDSDFGEKTFGALFNTLKHYPLETVKQYVKLAALNNAIWDTKNLKNVDTDEKVEQTANKITEGM